jgi:aldose 1-epimerase
VTLPPSGEQYELTWENQRAVVVEVGGGIRRYDVGERAVLQGYPRQAMCDGAHGAPLIPWPNRLADGHYSFQGTDYFVPVDEPEKKNAIHGLLRWRSWDGKRLSSSEVVMHQRLYPMQGYPFWLEVEIAYRLGKDGLKVTTTARNIGEAPLPFGAGQHPYLSPGTGLIDDCILQCRAGRRILTDDERQLPRGSEEVAGTEYDFSRPKRIGTLALDYPFTELERDSDGLAWVHLKGADERTVSMHVDESYHYIELYTADTLAEDRRRRGLGAEPMTCPPNAFQTGEDVISLQPGEKTSASWGVILQ